MDTGGIGALADADFAEAVNTEAQIAMDTADIILFLVDAREGLTPVDEAIAHQLRKESKKVRLVLNKSDHEELDHVAGDFARLGLGDGLSVSAAHGRNFKALLAELDAQLAPFAESALAAEESARGTGLKIVVIGKPNAGKSSLVNAILDDERTIVSEVAGTTRDAVDIPYDRAGERHTLIDTAGLRQRSRMDTSVEVFSAMRAERSIRRADLCLLVVDLSVGISAQDRKIARLVQREQNPVSLSPTNGISTIQTLPSARAWKKPRRQSGRNSSSFTMLPLSVSPPARSRNSTESSALSGK